MKTEPVFKELELHNVPCESLEYSDDKDLSISVDDVNEKRWQIKFRCMQCFRIISKDLGYNYNSDDFKDYRYTENGRPNFRHYILQIKDSEWLDELKVKAQWSPSVTDDVGKSKHFLIIFYDYQLEVIAQYLEVKPIN